MSLKLKHLDLFAGIGGFTLAGHYAGLTETVGFSEIDPYASAVLVKNFPNIQNYGDIRQITRETLGQDIDLITGGFPCQPFSVAGKRKGKADHRDLWPEMLRVIKEFRPTWIIGENVAGFVNMELDRTLTDLEAQGYATRPFVIPACAVGAPHRRDRVWIVANSGSIRQGRWEEARNKEEEWRKEVEYARRADRKVWKPWTEWNSSPYVLGRGNGLPNRIHRVKCLGNSIVPQIPQIIFQYIKTIESL